MQHINYFLKKDIFEKPALVSGGTNALFCVFSL